MIVEITRYPVTQHSKEAEQHSLMKLKANCKERNDALKQLRLQGDANNNKYVTLGCRIPVRRVLRVVTEKQSCIQCHNCLALLAPRNFARHERKCTGMGRNRMGVTSRCRENERLAGKPKDT
jgi:hypothetical protein